MNNPLGVSPSQGNQGTTRGKEKIFWPRWESNPQLRSSVTLPTELRGRTEKVGDDLGGESRRRESKGTYECCAASVPPFVFLVLRGTTFKLDKSNAVSVGTTAIKGIPQKLNLPMNFFETFPESSQLSTVSKKTIKMIGHHSRSRDMMGQSYPIYACTSAYHAHYLSVHVTFCGSSNHTLLK